jgi:hypothetical protein
VDSLKKITGIFKKVASNGKPEVYTYDQRVEGKTTAHRLNLLKAGHGVKFPCQ